MIQEILLEAASIPRERNRNFSTLAPWNERQKGANGYLFRVFWGITLTGWIIATSAEVTPNDGLVRKSRTVLHNGAEQQDVRKSLQNPLEIAKPLGNIGDV